jgi:hypothetical protein
MKHEKRMIGCRVSFPAPFYDELESLWMYESGSHHAIKFEAFLSVLVGHGLEVYKKTLPRWTEDAPGAVAGGAERITPAEADAWDRGEVDADPRVLRYRQ